MGMSEMIEFAVGADKASRFTVRHGSEVPYVYGFSDIGTDNAESRLISRAMMDYWISFVVSGTPNDGKGLSSTSRVLLFSRGSAQGEVTYPQKLFGSNTNLTTKYVRLPNEATWQ